MVTVITPKMFQYLEGWRAFELGAPRLESATRDWKAGWDDAKKEKKTT